MNCPSASSMTKTFMTDNAEQTLLVIGKNGQLARSIAKIAMEFSGLKITFSERRELDLVDLQSIDNYFSSNRYDIIINAAAYTAVDQAESEPQLADQVNHHAVKRLAQIALLQKSVLIQISTDYLFSGENNVPYREEDAPNPTCIYGKTKLKGEQAIAQISPRGCIVRTSWLYSEFGNNFVKTMLQLGREREALNVVIDQVGSPTYAVDLARVLLVIAENRTLIHSTVPPQIYHYANEGVCSWYDLAVAIFQLAQIECKVFPIVSEQYPTAARRPHYSVLSKEKIRQEFGVYTPYWKDALTESLQYMEHYND
jgi:dTDP-4-dehydrorhamnose reductase